MSPSMTAGLCTLLVVTGSAVPAASQTVSQQPFFVATRVQEARDSFALHVNGQLRGTYSMVVSRDGDNYRVRSEMVIPAADVREEREFVFGSRTLMPLSHVVRETARGEEVVTDVKVADGRARGSTQRGNASPGTIDVVLPQRTIDDEAVPVLLPTLEFTREFVMTFNTLDLSPAQILGNELRVLGIETVTVPAGTFDVWNVSVKYSTSPQPVTMFITTQQPQRVVLVRQGPLELRLVSRS